jgi:hypothetical protein
MPRKPTPKMKKCLKTLSGKHLWQAALRKNGNIFEGVVFGETGPIIKKCLACGMFDDLDDYAQETHAKTEKGI